VKNLETKKEELFDVEDDKLDEVKYEIIRHKYPEIDLTFLSQNQTINHEESKVVVPKFVAIPVTIGLDHTQKVIIYTSNKGFTLLEPTTDYESRFQQIDQEKSRRTNLLRTSLNILIPNNIKREIEKTRYLFRKQHKSISPNVFIVETTSEDWNKQVIQNPKNIAIVNSIYKPNIKIKDNLNYLIDVFNPIDTRL